MADETEAHRASGVTKFCPGCSRELPAERFGPRKQSPDGLRPRCKDCRQVYARAAYHKDLAVSREKGTAKARQWREANRERHNETARRWHASRRKPKPALTPEEIAARDVERYRRKCEARKRTYQKHKAKVLAVSAAYRAAHKAEEKANRAAHYQRNKERVAEVTKVYRIANPELYREAGARRRAAKLRATPPWADLEAIRVFYDEAERLTRETGILHEVDHVYPLQGRTACGLHIAANLQILTRAANRSKSNRLPVGA